MTLLRADGVESHTSSPYNKSPISFTYAVQTHAWHATANLSGTGCLRYDAQQRCRELDAEYSPLAGAPAGTRYPSPAERGERELRGPVLAAYEDAVGVMDGGQMHGLAVGSWQDCSVEVEALAGRLRTPWPRGTGG